MYCDCKKAPNGFRRQDEGDLWVCSRCGKPTRLVFDKMTDSRAPRGATSIVSVIGRSTGINETTWRMQDGGQVTTVNYHPYPWKVDMDQGRDLLLGLWQRMDEHMDRLMHPGTPLSDKPIHKACARQIAEIVVDFMPQFYDDTDTVVKEVVARYKARKDGAEHDTPGLAEAIWHRETDRFGNLPSEAPKAIKRTGNTIPDQAVATAKQALETGMFTLKQLATTYKMTEAEVKEQLNA